MRAAILSIFLISAIAGLATTAAQPVPPTARQRGAYDYSHDEVQTLRQQYVDLAEKRANGMDGPSLARGINEMRRQHLIAELIKLTEAEQGDEFDAIRAGLAAQILTIEDWTQLETSLAQWTVELKEHRKDSKPEEPATP